MKIEGLPEGFEVKEVLLIECESNDNDQRIYGAQVIVKKKQPRRIVLEETGEDNHKYPSGAYAAQPLGDGIVLHSMPKIWRSVKESDLSLPKEQSNEHLSLSVDECKQLLSLIMIGLVKSVAVDKLRDFIKDSK